MIEYNGSVVDIRASFSKAQLELIESLVSDGLIQFQDDLVSIPNNNFYQLDDFSRNWIGLPDVYDGFSRVRLEGAGLLFDESKLHVDYYSPKNQLLPLNKVGPFLADSNGFCYTIPEHVFQALENVEEFNNLKNRKEKSKGYLYFAKLKKSCDNKDVVLDSLLLNQEIIYPEKIKLGIEIEGDEVRINPSIDGVESFAEHFDKRNRVKNHYDFRDENNVKTRVLIDEESNNLLEQLEKIKEKSVYRGEEVKELVEKATEIFDSELVDLTALFGERVLGMQVFIPPAIPVINKLHSEWVPGFLVTYEYVLVNDEYDYILLKNAYLTSKEAELESVYYKGKNFHLEPVRSVLRISKLLFEEKRPIDESEIQKEFKEFLVVKDNVEELESLSVVENLKPEDFKIRLASNFNPEFELKEHQVQGVAWLQTSFFELKLPGVLLADDMGLGKTLQILYFLESLKEHLKDQNKPVLIVCPSSLLENWMQEYSRFFKDHTFDILVLKGNSTSELKGLREGSFKRPPICFTTYETMRSNAVGFCAMNWGVVVLDEAQKIKNPSALVTHTAKGLKTDFKIAMTGTPVENSLLDLWCLIDFCVPGRLGSVKQFNRSVNNQELDSDKIREIIDPLFLRRLKSDVAKDLPQKYEYYPKEALKGSQLDLYMNVLNQLSHLKKNDLLKGAAMLSAIFQMKSIIDHVEMVKAEQEINLDSLGYAAKIKLSLAIIQEIKEKGEKVIVFTEKRKMQFILRHMFKKEYGLSVDVVNGDVPSTSTYNDTVLTRQSLVDKFHQVDGFNIIIMSPIAAGFGLNVVGANHVIHYSRHWNPAKEQQATDRVYRIGQTKDVHIYYPIATLPDATASFDEILDNRLRRKKALSDDVMFPSESIVVSNEEILHDLLTLD
jgi:SNF2 family DNA or RNA helicase